MHDGIVFISGSYYFEFLRCVIHEFFVSYFYVLKIMRALSLINNNYSFKVRQLTEDFMYCLHKPGVCHKHFSPAVFKTVFYSIRAKGRKKRAYNCACLKRAYKAYIQLGYSVHKSENPVA